MQHNQVDGRNDFLIDGFPRNKDNLEGWNRVMGDKVNLKMVLFFDCDDQVRAWIAACLLYTNRLSVVFVDGQHEGQDQRTTCHNHIR